MVVRIQITAIFEWRKELPRNNKLDKVEVFDVNLIIINYNRQKKKFISPYLAIFIRVHLNCVVSVLAKVVRIFSSLPEKTSSIIGKGNSRGGMS